MTVESSNLDHLNEDTICALSTAVGTGGIAVIRVSGSKAFHFTRKVCGFLPEKPDSHRIYFGFAHTVLNSKQLVSEAIDQVLVSCFHQGRSFTGEETAEISCHGGPAIVRDLIAQLILTGVRAAKPGEFTFRAFMSGNIDLVQAESVLALVESQSRPAAKMALRQLRGDLSQRFARIEDDIVWILAQLEASIDFSEEDLGGVACDILLARMVEVIRVVDELLESYSQGRTLREGLVVVLVGPPNVGKSSLLNALLGEDRAIVTSEAGTTRDTVEGQLSVLGLPVNIIDTAGIRTSDSEVEGLGIRRSLAALKRADMIFHVLDVHGGRPDEDLKDFTDELEFQREKVFKIFNKIDLAPDFRSSDSSAILVSARSGVGVDRLRDLIVSRVRSTLSLEGGTLTQARHVEGLRAIRECLARAQDQVCRGSSAEFIAFELQDAVRRIHELLGKEFNEQVIDRIFKEFCLGK